MPANTKVDEVMSTGILVVRADESVATAADKMADAGISALPVVDADGKLIGLLRDDDLIVSEARVHAPRFWNFLGAVIPFPGEMKQLEGELRKVVGSTVADLMESNPAVTTAEASLEDVATLMHETDVRQIPVVDGQHNVVGIVTRGDIVRFIARTT